MSKKQMVQAFCAYWDIDDRDTKAIGDRFRSTMSDILSQLSDASLDETKRAELVSKLTQLQEEFDRVHWMVHMTACSHAASVQHQPTMVAAPKALLRLAM